MTRQRAALPEGVVMGPLKHTDALAGFPLDRDLGRTATGRGVRLPASEAPSSASAPLGEELLR